MLSDRQWGVISGSCIGVPISFSLEVLGVAAIWGWSDAFDLRNDNNNEAWRTATMIFAALAIFRYAKKYYDQPARNTVSQQSFSVNFFHAVVAPHQAIKDAFYFDDSIPADNPSVQRTMWLDLLIGVPVTFVLEVLGAAGAIWGSSEAFDLRHKDNATPWRATAMLFFGLGLLRYGIKYIVDVVHHSPRASGCKEALHQAITNRCDENQESTSLLFCDNLNTPSSCPSDFFGLLIGTAISFDLLVLGVSGAVWGISEVFWLRNQENQECWRPVAMVMGLLALVPYLAQYGVEQKPVRPAQNSSCRSRFSRHVVSPQTEFVADCIALCHQAPNGV